MNTKAITYERIIKAIYENLTDADLKNNIIEDEEYRAAYDQFHTQYVAPIYAKSLDEGDEMYDKLISLIFGRIEKAFNIGFEAALTLLSHKAGDKA